MANTALSKLAKLTAPGQAIRGPRRERKAAPPPEPTLEAASTAVPVHAAPAPVVAPPSLALAPVDAKPVREATRRSPETLAPVARSTNEKTVQQRRPVLTPVITPARQSLHQKSMWFSAGILLGAIVLSGIRGDLRGVRAWVADEIRSMKHGEGAELATTADTGDITASAGGSRADAVAADAPCMSDEDCAILMAPFKDQATPTKVARRTIPAIRTVRAEDLPRVRPPVAPPSVAVAAAPVATESATGEPSIVAAAGAAIAEAAAASSAAPLASPAAPGGSAAAALAATATASAAPSGDAPAASASTAAPRAGSSAVPALPASGAAPVAPAPAPSSATPPSTTADKPQQVAANATSP